MCGIVGYIGKKNAVSVVIEGLEKLEYRGYDSAGIALMEGENITVYRAKGKLSALKDLLKLQTPDAYSTIGLGHTRWATHGKPSEENAHPHNAGRITLIHNGIIENYNELKEELLKDGCEFTSETDTEVAAHLINREVHKFSKELGDSPVTTLKAFKAACALLKGSYAILAIDKKSPDRILVAKTATPIVIGVGIDETFIASDIPAVLNYTRDVIILEDGDIAEINASQVSIYNTLVDKQGALIKREIKKISWDPVTAQKGGFKHYMLKEIHDQVTAISDTLRGRVDEGHNEVNLLEIGLDADSAKIINRVVFVACGTAWHACIVAKYYIETICGIPTDVDYASEFRYRNPVLDKNTLVIAVSQSGETADTIAAIELAAKAGTQTLAVCNVLGSTLTRRVHYQLYTHAGPEISVASTKAFTTQLTSLYLLALYIGQLRGTLPLEKRVQFIDDVLKLPSAVAEAIKLSEPVGKLAKKYQSAKDFLYLARGLCYPIALEGALKLKEISYIHAEGYPAGEIKHGPLALIDEHMPVVVLLQRDDELFEKTVSNLREVESRSGKVLAFTDAEDTKDLEQYVDVLFKFNYVSRYMSPIILTVPMQLLAYDIAVHNGTDVDLPRNLAKSVTVE
jgi:glutamine---fructose-6-phosphate transaminase (isomerizing)